MGCVVSGNRGWSNSCCRLSVHGEFAHTDAEDSCHCKSTVKSPQKKNKGVLYLVENREFGD